jgi:VIT1/CCC1 family predicted Fe2+/Mn2+ transporter
MDALMRDLILLMAGFTASGIVANLYRMTGLSPERTDGQFLRVVVLMFAGPSELFEMAVEARISKKWSAGGFWLSISAVCYWSLILGSIVLHTAKTLTA